MDKFTELKAMADSLGMTVESTGTSEKEEFVVNKEGREVMRGSSEDVKNKLEDLIMDKDLDAKVRAMIADGKSDEEILKALEEEKEEGPLEEKVMEVAHAYGKELKKIILMKMREDMEKIKEEFEIDTAITPAYDLYMRTLKEELDYIV